jgi:hypothetical protein
MGPKTEGGVLDIHFGNKIDVDLCRNIVWWKSSNLTTVKKNSLVNPAGYLLEYDRLYEHHTYRSNGDPPGSTTSTTCG